MGFNHSCTSESPRELSTLQMCGHNAKTTESNLIPKKQQPELKTTVLLPRKTKSIDKSLTMRGPWIEPIDINEEGLHSKILINPPIYWQITGGFFSFLGHFHKETQIYSSERSRYLEQSTLPKARSGAEGCAWGSAGSPPPAQRTLHMTLIWDSFHYMSWTFGGHLRKWKPEVLTILKPRLLYATQHGVRASRGIFVRSSVTYVR